MSEYDLHNRVKGVHSIEHAIHTATKVGAEIDTKGFESIEYIIHVSDALVGGGFTALLEQSPDDGAGSPTGVWAAVPDAERLGDLPVTIATDTDLVLRVGSIGKDRHSRLTLTETGTVTAGIIGASAIMGNPKTIPTVAQAT